MKKYSVLPLVLVLLLVGLATADDEQAENPLIAAQAVQGTTPEGALTLWFDAVFLYMDENALRCPEPRKS